MAKRDVITRVGADTEEHDKKLAASAKRLDDFGAMAKKAGAALVTAFAAAAASAAALTARGIQLGDELAKSAQTIGIAADALAGLRHAAGLSNVETGALDTALVRLGKTVSEAHSGLASAKRAFQDLGLSIEDVRKLPLDEQMLVVGDAMNDLTSHVDKLRVSQELFGRAGADLIPLFEEGSAAIRQQAAEARRLGLTLDATQSKHIQAASDSMTKLNAAVDGVALKLGAEFSPEIKRATSFLADFVTEAGEATIELADLGRKLIGVQKAAADLGDARLVERIEKRRAEILALSGKLDDDAPMSGIARVSAEAQLAKLRREQSDDYAVWTERVKANSAAMERNAAAQRAAADAQARLNELTKEFEPPERKLIVDQLPAEPENLKDFPQKIAEAQEATRQQVLEAQKSLSAARLELLREEFATETEIELERYAQQVATLHEAELTRSASVAEINALREQAEEEHQKRMQKIREKAGQSELGVMGKLASSKFAQAVSSSAKILGLLGTENKRAFELSKKFALAQAAIEMPQAIMSAVARAGGLPFGAWAGALTAAEFIARIGAIRRQQFDAGPSGASVSVGGGGMAAAPVASSTSGPAAVSRTMVVQGFDSSMLFTGSQMRTFAKEMVEFMRDGGDVVFDKP